MKSVSRYVLAGVCAGLLEGGGAALAGTVFTTETKVQAFDGAAGDEFGRSVAIDGNTAVVCAWRDDVGANADQGSAYVYVFNGTAWVFQQMLVASDGVKQADFGKSVAIQGDTIVIGASATKVGNNTQQGKVYVFTRTANQWTQSQALLAGDGAALDHFGTDVSLDGNYMVIGASEDTVVNTFQGSAYVFQKSNGVWTQQQKLVAADGGADTDFANSVSISGDTVVIGSRNATSPLQGQGAVYVFVRSGTAWSLQQKLLASDAGAYEQFGFDVSLDGDTLIVGKRLHSPAYAIVRSGTVWTEQARLVPGDLPGEEDYGFSVSLDGNRAVVGSLSTVGTNSKRGAVYVYDRVGTAWTRTEKLFAADGLAQDYLGYSVGVSGGVVIAGAVLDDEPGKSAQGAAYLFQQSVIPINLSISLNAASNELTLTWNALPGRLYVIKGSVDLTGFPTTVLAAFDPPGDVATYSFAKPAGAKMFYRVEDAGAAP